LGCVGRFVHPFVNCAALSGRLAAARGLGRRHGDNSKYLPKDVFDVEKCTQKQAMVFSASRFHSFFLVRQAGGAVVATFVV
jgi:hypothetical protein